MDRKYEKKILELEMFNCALIDCEIRKHIYYDENEFDYYSPTTKRVCELANTYFLTSEELDDLWNLYYDACELIESEKEINKEKESQDNDRN